MLPSAASQGSAFLFSMTQEGCQPGQDSANSTTVPASSRGHNVFKWHFTLAATVSRKGSTLGKGKRSWGCVWRGVSFTAKEDSLGSLPGCRGREESQQIELFLRGFREPEARRRGWRKIPAHPSSAAASAPDGLSILPAVPAQQGL